MKKRTVLLLFGLIGLLIFCTGCGKEEEKAEEQRSETATEATTEKETEEEIKNTTLYIGKEGSYGKYNWPYTGKLTMSKVLKGISETTGWNLSLDKKITKKTDGYIVCFSEKSVFYTGQKLEQEDEFYIFDTEDFYVTVLDSITKTFQKTFKEKGEKMNLYYWGAEDSVLKLTGTNKTIQKDVAYDHKLIGSTTKRRYIGGASAKQYDLEVTFVRMQGDEEVVLQIDGSTEIYSVTYTALKAIFKQSQEGREMKIQITEDTDTGDKLITKIY